MKAPFNKDNYFYNENIRRYTKLFGWLFSDFVIKRDNTFIKIPLIYGRGYSYERIPQTVSARETKRNNVLPAFSFALTSVERDGERQQNHFQKIQHSIVNSDGTRNAQMYRTPYNYQYELKLYVKNLDDGFQVLEQIVSTFTPSYNIKIKDILHSEVDVTQDVVITLDSFDEEDNGYDTDEKRVIQYTFNFTLRGYMYGKTVEVPTINMIELVGVMGGEEFVFSTFEDPERDEQFMLHGKQHENILNLVNPSENVKTKTKKVNNRRGGQNK